MSDMWKAHDCLKDEGFTHLTVNHSLNFVGLDTGAHTQGNENTWWGVKWSTVISGRLPAGNVLIFLQTVAGAGYRKVQVMW